MRDQFEVDHWAQTIHSAPVQSVANGTVQPPLNSRPFPSKSTPLQIGKQAGRLPPGRLYIGLIAEEN
jgi:hypothetical protein